MESHDSFDDVGDFDPDSGRLYEFSRSRRAGAISGPLQGHFACLAGTLVVLYRRRDSLWLRIGEGARELDDDGSSVRWEHRDDQSIRELLDDGETIAQVDVHHVLNGL